MSVVLRLFQTSADFDGPSTAAAGWAGEVAVWDGRLYRQPGAHRLRPGHHQTAGGGPQGNTYCNNSTGQGVRCSSVVRAFTHRAMGRRIDPPWWTQLSYFSSQPVLHDWCIKGCGMCYPVCGMMHIKKSLLLIGWCFHYQNTRIRSVQYFYCSTLSQICFLF